MSLTVTQRPVVTSPVTSEWNAVGNPIIYKFQRKDYNITAVANSAGALQITVNVNLTTLPANKGGAVTIGATMWVVTDNGVYNGLYTVVSVTNAANSVVTFGAATFISAATTGYINLTQRLNYKVQIGVYSTQLLGTLRVSPDKSGQVIVDISRVLWSSVTPDSNADLTLFTNLFNETNTYLNFHVRHTEIWIGSAEVETNDSANNYFALYGARQIKSLYGGNMLEYATWGSNVVLNETGFSSGWTNGGLPGVGWVGGATDISATLNDEFSQRARRALPLKKGMVYTVNMVFSNSNTNVITLQLYAGGVELVDFGMYNTVGPHNQTREFKADDDYKTIEIFATTQGTGTSNGIAIDTIIITEQYRPFFLTKFVSPVMWRGWPCLISLINTVDTYLSYLSDATTTTTPAVQPDRVLTFDLNNLIVDQTVSSKDIAFYFDNPGSIRYSELMTAQIRDACDNPIMLIGRNSLGGALPWMFDISQEFTFTYDDGVKRKRLSLIAENLTLNEWEALQDFVTLGEVYNNPIVEFSSSVIKTQSRIGSQAYAVDKYGNKTGVIVIPNSNTTNTRQERHVFTLEIEYPETFTT